MGYSLQNLYGDIYREVLDAVTDLTFAVYQLESYGVDTGEQDTDERVAAAQRQLPGHHAHDSAEAHGKLGRSA